MLEWIEVGVSGGGVLSMLSGSMFCVWIRWEREVCQVRVWGVCDIGLCGVSWVGL